MLEGKQLLQKSLLQTWEPCKQEGCSSALTLAFSWAHAKGKSMIEARR